MKSRLIKAMMIVLLIQVTLFSLVIFGKNTVQTVTSEYLNKLDNRVLIRKNDVEDEMLQRWSNITDFEEYIQSEVNDLDSTNDPTFISQLLEDMAEETVFYLRQSGATEIFVILEGEEEHEGIHLRDLDPSFNSRDNSDVLMKRGSMDIAQKVGVPLGSKWSYTFDLSPEEESSDFYYKPYEAAKTSQYTTIKDLGYWSKPFRLSPDDLDIITYSLPLIDASGEPYGVMGIGLTADFLEKKLKYDELTANKRGFYMLNVHEENTGKDQRIITSGPMSNVFGESKLSSYEELDSWQNMYKVENYEKIEEDFYASSHDLLLYNENTPFAQEQWSLTGFVRKQDLFQPVYRLFMSLAGSLVLSLLIGIVAVYVIGTLFMKPINKLMRNITESDPNVPLQLNKTDIPEIDELGSAIENLNAEVLDSASKLSQIFNLVNLPIGAFEYTTQDDQAFCTHTFFEILGMEQDQAVNYIPKTYLIAILEKLKQDPEEKLKDVYRYHRADGKNSWIELTMQLEEGRVLGVIEDVTEAIIHKRKLEYERDHDVLTHLLNRRAFASVVKQKMMEGIPGHSAFVMWDLDNLKYVNDTYGHEYGDRYIQKTAEVLKSFAIYRTVIARMSGDEFYLFIYDYEDKEEIREMIEEIKENLYDAFLDLPDGEKIRIRASGGVSWYPDDSTDYDELIKYTDFAMYEIKNKEKGNVGEFNKEIYERDSILLDGKEELNFLIDHAKVKYAFQPIISAKTGEIFAYESLMRPLTKKMKSPYDVIRLAQSQSKLYEIERLTFFETMRTYEKYKPEFKDAKVFINSLANTTLSEEDLMEFESEFSDALHQIVMEITENEQANEKCTKLKQTKADQWGTHLALDDFGSGYNSELSLLVLSPKYVKVDMHIVRNIDQDVNRQKLLTNMLSYCKNRGIKTIAEGVETSAEMETLIGFGVDYMQGYYLGKPHFVPQEINPAIQREIETMQKTKE